MPGHDKLDQLSHLSRDDDIEQCQWDEVVTFWERDYDEMYQMLESMTVMETPFNLPNNSANSKYILKIWERS